MGYYIKTTTYDRTGSGSIAFNVSADSGDIAVSAGWEVTSAGRVRKLKPSGTTNPDTWNVEFEYDSDASVTIKLVCLEV